FEPSSDPTARNGFRDRAKIVTCRDFCSLLSATHRHGEVCNVGCTARTYSVAMHNGRPSRSSAVRRFPPAIASDRRFVFELWLLVAYLLIVYASIRWGHPSRAGYPGSD